MSCQHEGFWQCMDTLQEKLLLEQMIAEMHRGWDGDRFTDAGRHF